MHAWAEIETALRDAIAKFGGDGDAVVSAAHATLEPPITCTHCGGTGIEPTVESA